MENTLLDIDASIHNIKEETNTKLERKFASLYKVHKAISSLLRFDELLPTILDAIIKEVNAERGFFMLFDEKGKVYMEVERNIERSVFESDSFRYNRVIAESVAHLGESIFISDLRQEVILGNITEKVYFPQNIKADDISPLSIICVPLKIGSSREVEIIDKLRRSKTIGVIYIDSKTDKKIFTNDDLELLTLIANQVALPIENSYLHEKLESKTDELNKIAEIQSLATSATKLDELLTVIIDRVIESIRADRGFIMLFEQKQFVFKAGRDSSGNNLTIDKFTLNEGALNKVMETGESACIVNLNKVDSFISVQSSIMDLNIWGVMCVPLKVKDKLVGLLYVENSSPDDAFSERDLELLETFANHIALSIDNIQLYEENKNTRRKLKKKIFEMSSIFDLSRELTASIDKNAILGNLLFTSMGNMGVESGAIMLLDDKTGEFILSASGGLDEKNIRNVKFNFESPVFNLLKSTKNPHFISQLESSVEDKDEIEKLKRLSCFLCVPMVKEDELKGLLTLGERGLGQTYTEDDLEMLSTLANQGLVALENARLYEELAEKERIAQELKIARDIQMKLLPQTTPKIEGFEVYSISEPAKEVGGDFFDYLTINENCIGLCVGDVSGKGVPAALYMAVTDSILQAQAANEVNPSKVLLSTNQILCRKVAKYRSVVMVYIVLEPAKRIARISNCGLVSPILYSRDEITNEPKCSYIKVSGMPMGISKKGSYDQKEITLKKGDIILICSDGIVEAKNSADEMFGSARLEKSLMESAELFPSQIVNKIIKDVNKFVGDAPQYDDITLMVLKCTQ